jgi:hypothetical protein
MTENMRTQPFSIGGAIGFGWKRSWKNFWWLLLVGILFTVINAIITLATAGGEMGGMDMSDPAALQEQLNASTGSAIGLIGSVIQFLVTVFLGLGVIRIALAVTSGDRVRIGRLWSFQGFGRYLLASIVVAIVVGVALMIPFGIGLAISAGTDQIAWLVIGLVLGLIAAILLGLGFSFYGYVIVDKNATGLSSLGESWRLIKPHFGGLLGLHIVVGLVLIGTLIVAVLLGILLVFVGLLVTIPIAGVLVFGIPAFTFAYAYRTLAGEPIAA